MKILYYTALFATFIVYVIASSDITDTEFREAVDQRNLEIAMRLYVGARREHAEYLVEKASTDFIVKFAKQASFKWPIITALYTNGSKEKREEVFEKVSFNDFMLGNAVTNHEIPCQPEHFLDLLGRITTPKGKDRAIKHGIETLLWGEKHTDCINPLLNALKDKKDLESDVLRVIFRETIEHRDKDWIGRFLSHPAITPTFYADKLVIFLRGGNNLEDPIFKFLLSEADRGDLKAFLDNEDYKKWDLNARRPINRAIVDAFLKANSAGSRHSTREKVKKAKEVINEITEGRGGLEIGNLVADYFE